MIRTTKIVVKILMTVFLFTVFIVYWELRSFASAHLTICKEIIYTVPINTNGIKLTEQLEKQHIIPKSIWLNLLFKLKPSLSHFKAGTYRLKSNMTVHQLLDVISQGKVAQFPIRFFEGSRLKDWLIILRKTPYIEHTLKDDKFTTVASKLKININQLEGSFYPDTYLYIANSSDQSLLQRAHERMTKIVNEIWQKRMDNLPYKKVRDMVTIASIIEKETALNEERPVIASVLINRLRIGMKLQTDPTVIYGMGDHYNGKLTHKDLKKPNGYNTYDINGLPLGPIAMPGRASLEAAAHPQKTNYLYFVANGKGGHVFNTNLVNHNKAVNFYYTNIKKKHEE